MILSVGIIGFGFMGPVHYAMLKRMTDRYLVTAVCDINPARLSEMTNEPVHTYTDMIEFMKDPSFTHVIIALPNHLHLQAVQEACQNKKHIILEKPAALNVHDYEAMLAAVKKAGIGFTVHQQRRFDLDFNVAKTVYCDGTLGDVFRIKSSLYGYNGNMHDWHVYKEFGGGMLYDWGVHLFDQILCMVHAPVESVFADLRNIINREVDDYFNVQLRFANGVNAEVELGTYFLASEKHWFERHWFIGGNKGSMKADGFNPQGQITRTTALLQNVPGKITMTAAGPTRSFGPPPEGRIVTEELPKVNVSHDMFFAQYYDWADGKGELPVKPEEIHRLVKLIAAIQKSAETRSLVLGPI